MSLKITFELDIKTVQTYLDHWNEVHGNELALTDDVADIMAKAFGDLAKGELEMRTDDLDGFEAEEYFPGFCAI